MPAARRIDEPGPLDVRAALIRAVLERISGIRVGTVTAYDPTKRTADVQPVRRRRIWGTPTDQQRVLQAPVCWWRFGSMVLAGELEAGDEVLLVTCEREVWPWYATGGPHDPQSERMHDATDSIVLPWISSLKRAITARQPGTLWIGREDGTAGVTITMGPLPGRTTIEGTGPGSIVLGSAAVSPVVLHQAFTSAFATFIGSIVTAAEVVTGPPGMPVPPDPTGALYTAFAEAVGAAASVLGGTIAAMASIKVVAE